MDISTALNYSTHAIEDLEGSVAGLRRNGFVGTAAVHEQAAKLLREAVKFNLPERGDLVDLGNSDESFSEFIRLPFDAVALEARFSSVAAYNGDEAFAETASSRRIALCWTPAVAARYPALCPHKTGGEGFYVASVYIDDAVKRWILSPLVSYFPPNPAISRGPAPVLALENGSESEAVQAKPGFDAVEREFLLKRGVIKPGNVEYQCATVSLCPEMVMLLANQTGSLDQALARLSIDVRDESMTAIGFCLTINSSNVGRNRLAPPEKLNKKRIANGHPPFYESWVLDLVKKPAVSPGRGGYELEGQRNTPRMHLRRGHIRRLDLARITYVRAATVGAVARGFVDKTYRL